jgi:hypothetical protein
MPDEEMPRFSFDEIFAVAFTGLLCATVLEFTLAYIYAFFFLIVVMLFTGSIINCCIG